jgi:regulator of protease activity HflC (stomatin/prohibitin superfamily)
MIREKPVFVVNGWGMLLLLLAAIVASTAGYVWFAVEEDWFMFGLLLFVSILAWLATAGFVVVGPNEGWVIQVLGAYAGTAREPGFWWTIPFAWPRTRVSLRIRNFESARLKVNEHDGNPIEIAAVVVWQVVDSAEAKFVVDDYENFVRVQSEAALRNLATSYPYDTHLDDTLALRTNSPEINQKLRQEIEDRLQRAGIEVIEARISHLAYAPEIASAMLQRQQAGAIVAARTRIVEGAVGMVEMALDDLATRGVIDLDSERKAAMVSNLLVVLCSHFAAQPVINTGTLYQG